MSKKILSMFLALSMVLSLLPVLAIAEETSMPSGASTSYNIWVGGVQVTDVNKNDITGTGITGTVTYDPDTSALTLNDARISNAYTGWGGDTFCIYSEESTLILNLIGENFVTGVDSIQSTYGIRCKGELTIEGGGSLTVTPGKAYIDDGFGNNHSSGILTEGGLTINDVVLDIWGEQFGIYEYWDGNIAINGGTISATGQKAGISCERLIISHGNVTGIATTSGGYGIGDILNLTVSGDATVTAIGTDGARATSRITTTDPTHYVIAGDSESDAEVVASPDASTWAKAYVKLLPGNTISGTITSGERCISGASIQIQTSGVDFGAPAITAADGTYTTQAVPDGSYTIKVSKVGYIDADIAEFTLSGSRVADKDLDLTAAPLTGTVTISGILKYGETLETTYGSGNNTGTLSFQWKRSDTDVGTGSTYTIVEADINHTLICEVTSTEQTGSVTGVATSTISKADGPVVTDVSAVNCTSISNNDGKLVGVTIHMEYKKSDAPDYVDGTGDDLTGLTSGTYLVRVKETTTHNAGAESPFTVGAYAPSALTGAATISNTAPRIGDELKGELDGGNNTGTLTYLWKADGEQVGTGESYTVATEDLGKTITLEISSSVQSDTVASAPTAAVAKKAAPSAPGAPTLVSKTHNTVTLAANAAYEFSKDRTTWQTGNVFSGLTASTAYTFYQRIAATADTETSAASTGFSVTTSSKNGGGSGSSSSGSGGSSSDDGSSVIVTPPAPDKPNSPTQGEIEVPGTVDSNGITTVNITDIAGHWAKGDIKFVVSRGLLGGTSATTFSPNLAMTRGMFVAALGRLVNAEVSSFKQSSFTDVNSDAYYMGYIEWASENNMVYGIGNGKFAPDQSITREQMAVILRNYAKVIGITLPKVHGENTFEDSAKISAYAKNSVKQMQMAGLINGRNGRLFDPQGIATRAEVSAVLRRLVELQGDVLRVPEK